MHNSFVFVRVAENTENSISTQKSRTHKHTHTQAHESTASDKVRERVGEREHHTKKDAKASVDFDNSKMGGAGL